MLQISLFPFANLIKTNITSFIGAFSNAKRQKQFNQEPIFLEFLQLMKKYGGDSCCKLLRAFVFMLKESDDASNILCCSICAFAAQIPVAPGCPITLNLAAQRGDKLRIREKSGRHDKWARVSTRK